MKDILLGIFEHGKDHIYILTTMMLILCGCGIPFPEEATFLFAGYACAKAGGNVWLLCVAGLIGIMAGDSIPYYVGHRYGMKFLQMPVMKKYRFLAAIFSQKNIDRTKVFFEKKGKLAVFMARFVAGFRMPAFFTAGAMGVPYWQFFLSDLAGALISCPTSIWLAYTFGEEAEKMVAKSDTVLFSLIGVAVLYGAYHIWSHRAPKEDAETPADSKSKDSQNLT